MTRVAAALRMSNASLERIYQAEQSYASQREFDRSCVNFGSPCQTDELQADGHRYEICRVCGRRKRIGYVDDNRAVDF